MNAAPSSKLHAHQLAALSQRDDVRGLLQSLGVFHVATCTGLFTYYAWNNGYWFAALLGLIAHGNVCSLFISAVHEFAHGTVFKTRWLNTVFDRLYSLLNWTDTRDYFATHKSHHAHPNHEDDAELHGSCRPLWLGTFVWSAVFNVPRFVGSVIKCRLWILLTHFALAFCFLAIGHPELIVLISLAPFWFGWLELLVNYPQHAGMKLGSDDLRETTRSLKLPAWLSFLHWHMEFHYEHHKYASVPCYRLKELSKELGARSWEQGGPCGSHLPAPCSLLSAWSFILRNRNPGQCGHGLNPLQKLWPVRHAPR